MIWLFYGVVFSAGLYFLLRWYAHTPYQNVRRALGGFAIAGLIIVFIAVILAALRGSIAFLPLLLVVIPTLRRVALAVKGDAGGGQGATSSMSRAEAFEILDLPPTATKAEIKRAYRDMMRKMHPDHGGSDWMATRLNEAKRILLDE